jgi:sialate O-acetylesterase
MYAVTLLSVLLQDQGLRVPAFFSDHMVLQRGKKIAVWGWDVPGREVTIRLGSQSIVAKTESNGKFSASLPRMREGGPYQLSISGSSTKTFQDVLVGEVWICSGQSNMEWVVANSFDRSQAQSEADPNIRMFTVQKTIAQTPMADVRGSWVVAAPNSVDSFSAVGYAFAKRIFKDLKVPIGMIHTSWGGTPAEAWMSEEFIKKSPVTEPITDRAQAVRNRGTLTYDKFLTQMTAWEKSALPAFFDNRDLSWTLPGAKDSGWSSVEVPHTYPAEFDGSYYYRRTFNLNAEEANGSKMLSLGAIDDLDQTYVNGVLVGSTTMTTPTFWAAPRNYTIPAGLLKEGVNLIAIHTYDSQGPGGFSGSKGDLKIGSVSLAGTWQAKQGAAHIAPDVAKIGQQPQMDQGVNSPNFPATLYNGMLVPLAPYSVRGAIWYQGESNAGRAFQYTSLLSNMIANWRSDFKQGDFPFYIVQLANFMKPSDRQFDSAWAELRDAQDKVGQEKGNGTATIIDIGDADDIHPRNKRDVGERLARIALRRDYGKRIEWQGPRLKRAEQQRNELRVWLNHAKGLKTLDGKAPTSFAICAADGKWVWADTRIDGESVILSHASIAKPLYARYAWQDNPRVNLVNEDNLPAMPFRTDTFLPVTSKNL